MGHVNFAGYTLDNREMEKLVALMNAPLLQMKTEMKNVY